jgi:hypothetical protein
MHVQRFLAQFHDQEVDGPLRRTLHEHVVTCAECSRALALLDQQQELLQRTIDESLEGLEFSAFWDGVERKIADQQPETQWRWRRQLWWETWRSWWAWPTPGWLATAAAVLFLGVAVLTWQRSTPSPSPSPPPIAFREPDLNIDNDQAQIESLSAANAVSVWNEPVKNSTVIWVSDESEGD